MRTRRHIITTKPHNRLKLLFADDEPSLQQLMSLELPRMGHEATICPDGLKAVAALEVNTYDCILVDLDMPGMNGIEVITRCKEMSPDTEAVVLTGKSSLETAVAALRQGAFDYMTKPYKLAELESLLDRVCQKRELKNKYRAAKRQLERLEGAPTLVGTSPSIEQVRRMTAKVAPTNSTVLVRGETGTGKELVARAVHDQSERVEMPFVAINCGALPENLIESELFGHRKGAFTGADDHRVGLFEVANGGTIFLDEIGELPKAMQAKLLRVLESGEIRRVGENESVTIDVRAVCATLRDVEQMVVDGDFREDLLFRINTFEIVIPPLRERVEDIADLALCLLQRVRPSARSIETAFTDETIEALERHVWPGNVRELANVVEHAAILCDEGEPIAPEHLPRNLDRRQLRAVHPQFAAGQSLREIEMQAIYQALDRHAGSKPTAAKELGISLKTLYNKLSQASNLERSA